MSDNNDKTEREQIAFAMGITSFASMLCKDSGLSTEMGARLSSACIARYHEKFLNAPPEIMDTTAVLLKASLELAVEEKKKMQKEYEKNTN